MPSPLRIVLPFALALSACHSNAVQGKRIADEPAPTGPLLGDTLCLSGVARYDALTQPSLLAAEIAQYQALGVKRIRYDLDWMNVEKVQGQYTLDWLEQPLSMLEKAGIKSIPILDYGNPLYNSASDGDPKFPPTTPAPYAAFAAAVAQRFGTRLGPYELWNEPNEGYRFFKPKEDPAQYASLLLTAATSIKQVCPSCQTIFGGVFWHQEVGMGGPDFIKATYAAEPSLHTVLDGLGLHPYAYYPPQAAPDSDISPEVPFLDMYAQAEAATGTTPAPPVWITEVGWPIQAGSVDEATQASHLLKMYALSSKVSSQATCWYDLQDGPNAGSFPPEDDFGLLHYDRAGPSAGKPKRAFLAMQTVSKLLGSLGYSRDRGQELGLDQDGDAALLFRDPAGKHAATVLWRTDTGLGTTVVVPLHADGKAALYDDAGSPLPLTPVAGKATVTVGVEPVILVE